MDRSEDPTIAALAGPPGAASAAPPSAPLEAALVAAQRGDPDAFRLLYRDTQPRLLRYLHALTGDDAEDIASETWLHIARDLHTFHGNHDAFRSWAATIARHRALDHLRRHTRPLPQLAPPHRPPPRPRPPAPPHPPPPGHPRPRRRPRRPRRRRRHRQHRHRHPHHHRRPPPHSHHAPRPRR